jgi:CHASE2 domain-containing sensor protein
MSAGFSQFIRLIARHPLSRAIGVTGAIGLVLVSLPPLADLSYDLSYLARPRAPTNNVIIVAANEKSLQSLGDGANNIHRRYHTALLNRLAQEGPSVVFYDFLFTATNRDPEVDRELEQAIRNWKPVKEALSLKCPRSCHRFVMSLLGLAIPNFPRAKSTGRYPKT